MVAGAHVEDFGLGTGSCGNGVEDCTVCAEDCECSCQDGECGSCNNLRGREDEECSDGTDGQDDPDCVNQCGPSAPPECGATGSEDSCGDYEGQSLMLSGQYMTDTVLALVLLLATAATGGCRDQGDRSLTSGATKSALVSSGPNGLFIVVPKDGQVLETFQEAGGSPWQRTRLHLGKRALKAEPLSIPTVLEADGLWAVVRYKYGASSILYHGGESIDDLSQELMATPSFLVSPSNDAVDLWFVGPNATLHRRSYSQDGLFLNKRAYPGTIGTLDSAHARAGVTAIAGRRHVGGQIRDMGTIYVVKNGKVWTSVETSGFVIEVLVSQDGNHVTAAVIAHSDLLVGSLDFGATPADTTWIETLVFSGYNTITDAHLAKVGDDLYVLLKRQTLVGRDGRVLRFSRAKWQELDVDAFDCVGLGGRRKPQLICQEGGCVSIRSLQ